MVTGLVSQSISKGWSTFIVRPWYIIGVLTVVFGISILISFFVQEVAKTSSALIIVAANAFDFFVVQVLISMGLIHFALALVDRINSAKLSDAWAPSAYLNFLGASILMGLITLFGFVLLIIPGIIAAVFLIFVPYIVVDRGLTPVAAIKKSFHMVKGHFWSVLLLMLLLFVLNIAGALFFGIGLLLTVPVSMLTIVHAYRTLS
jgi:uncharacterized membrane protein